MAKITIIDGNDEIELSTAPKENIKAYMVKGASGSDGISPTATVSKVDDTTTITITDKNGTTEADVLDGYNPRVEVSKSNRVTTLTKTDYYGTETVEINDGVDLTGGVPTNGVIGWTGEDKDIPNGYELSDESFDYTSLTNKPQINGVELSGNKTSNDLGITIPTPKATKTTSDTDTYSCNYVNNIVNLIYPVGSIYISVNSTNPSILFGGTWEQINGKMIIGYDPTDSDFNTLGATGGSKTHTQTIKELASHTHTIGYANYKTSISTSGQQIYTNVADNISSKATKSSGSSEPMNIMNPYYVANIWKRTA